MSRPIRPVIVALAALLALSACAPSTPPVDEPIPEVDVESTPDPATTEAAPVDAPGICDLLTPAEVATVIDPAYVSSTYSFGALGDPIGGTCIWSNDPTGDIFTDDARVLELVVYVPGSVNPPPAEAPGVGTGGTVATDSGVYFVSDEYVFLIRVSGAASQDPAAIAAARDLPAAVLGRV